MTSPMNIHHSNTPPSILVQNSPSKHQQKLSREDGSNINQKPWSMRVKIILVFYSLLVSTILSTFDQELNQEIKESSNSDCVVTMAVITALAKVLQLSTATTMHNLQLDIREAVTVLKNEHRSIEVKSSCELFQAYVTRAWADLQDFDLLKSKLMKRGDQFKANVTDSHRKIARLASSFIRDNMVILSHGHSPLVNNILLHAMDVGRRFKVIFTTANNQICFKTVKLLLSKGIQVTVIPDSSVAHIMSEVDIVLVGAFAVVESGGILNQIGTYQLSIVAKALNKPVYCAAQSFKFTRSLYPLTQKDIPRESTIKNGNKVIEEIKEEFPEDFHFNDSSLNYTPPNYLTLLFTDLGILTPSAVSDELIKLYS